MQTWDWVFLALLVVDGIALGVMGVAVLAMLRRGKALAGTAKPAIQHGRGIAEHGKQLAAHAASAGKAVLQRCREVTALVQKRVQTTRHLVQELRPALRDAGEVRALAQTTRAGLARGREWAGRLGRLRRAASTASSRTSEGGDG